MKGYTYKTKPYEHQKEVLDGTWSKKEHALFLEMGCGKSKILIDNLAWLYQQGKIDSVLIVAPKGVYNNWVVGEIPDHLPESIKYDLLKWSPTETKKNQTARKEALEPTENLSFLIMNVEALSTKKGSKFAFDFLFNKNTLFAVDESTTIKSPSANRTKNIVRLSKYAQYRRILTGSPVTRSPLDLYTQCEFLDPALLGYNSYYSFRARYAEMINRSAGGRSFKQVIGYKRLDELNALLKTFSSRVLKKDCLDLPDKIYITRTIELTPEQRKTYDELKKYAITDLYNEAEQRQQVSVTSVLTKMLRLHQIACGFTTTDEEENIELKSKRIDELMSILEESEGKAVIWANYRYDIKRIVNEIRKTYGDDSVGSYFGDTSDADRAKNLEKFQDLDSPMRFIVGNTQTAGYGINLTAASTVVYYSNNFDLEKRLQSEDRAHRIGQVNKVTYIDIICKDTVDEKIVKALLAKQNIAAQVLGEAVWKDWIQ